MSDERIKIFLADDHPMIRRGLVTMIEAESDMAVVGEADNGAEAAQRIPATAPDVALLDLVMPRMDGIAVISLLRPRMPDTRFVLLTSLVDPGEIRRAIDAGASGYMLKTASAQELVTMIRSTHAGRRVLSPEATDAMIAASQQRRPGGDLTSRERELLGLMTRGLGNQQIADELAIALPTVKFHITNILSKLHAENRTEAVLIALKHKLV